MRLATLCGRGRLAVSALCALAFVGGSAGAGSSASTVYVSAVFSGTAVQRTFQSYQSYGQTYTVTDLTNYAWWDGAVWPVDASQNMPLVARWTDRLVGFGNGTTIRTGGTGGGCKTVYAAEGPRTSSTTGVRVINPRTAGGTTLDVTAIVPDEVKSTTDCPDGKKTTTSFGVVPVETGTTRNPTDETVIHCEISASTPCTKTVTDGLHTPEITSSVTTTLTVTEGDSPNIPAPPGIFDQAKRAAKKLVAQDIVKTTLDASLPCLLSVVGTGAIVINPGPGSALAALGLRGGIAGAGGTLLGAFGPTCEPLVERIILEYALLKNHDPPLHLRAATAVPCSNWTGSMLQFCEAARAAGTALLAKTNAATATAQALGAAVSANAHARVASLTAALAKALTQEAAARDALEAVLTRYGVTVTTTPEQAAKAASVLVRKTGIPQAALARYDPALLGPVPLEIGAPATASTGLGGGQAGGSAPTITSLAVAGPAANPSFVIRGTNLGRLPAPDPAAHPAGQGGCPSVPGRDGYDYGTNLYVAVPARSWSGGRHRADLHEIDCIDLVVTEFTPTEVRFHFGPFYAKNFAHFPLENGDGVEVGVNGAVKAVHVKLGGTATG
jgi:hypothetical protein